MPRVSQAREEELCRSLGVQEERAQAEATAGDTQVFLAEGVLWPGLRLPADVKQKKWHPSCIKLKRNKLLGIVRGGQSRSSSQDV